MKKMLVMMLIVLVLLVFAACGGNGSTAQPREAANQPAIQEEPPVDDNVQDAAPQPDTNQEIGESALEFWFTLYDTRFALGEPISAWLEYTRPTNDRYAERLDAILEPGATSTLAYRLRLTVIETEGRLGRQTQISNVYVTNPTQSAIPIRDGIVTGVTVDNNAVHTRAEATFLHGLVMRQSSQADIVAALGEPDRIRELAGTILTYRNDSGEIEFRVSGDLINRVVMSINQP